MMKYFNELSLKMGTDEFKNVARVSPECYEDIWLEMDKGNTGYISWHSVKDLIVKLVAHEEELKEERKVLQEFREQKAERKRIRAAEKEAARLAEEERLRKEAEENGEQNAE